MVDVICYGKRETWSSRDKAIEFYLEGVMTCDGAEKNRYLNVYFDLLNGKRVCSDGFPERKEH